MIDHEHVLTLLRECERRLAVLDAARDRELATPQSSPGTSVLKFIHHERAIFAFGVFLLNEVQRPTDLWRQQFP